MSNRKETIRSKTLEIIRANPGLTGVDLVARYRPAGEVLCFMSKHGLIEWDEELVGWVAL